MPRELVGWEVLNPPCQCSLTSSHSGFSESIKLGKKGRDSFNSCSTPLTHLLGSILTTTKAKSLCQPQVQQHSGQTQGHEDSMWMA